jgi:hypothetical protein
MRAYAVAIRREIDIQPQMAINNNNLSGKAIGELFGVYFCKRLRLAIRVARRTKRGLPFGTFYFTSSIKPL